jgi:hypothetical protein
MNFFLVRLIKVSLLSICALFITACQTTIKTSKAISTNTVEKGIKYHLPADIFTIKTKKTLVKSKKISDCLIAEPRKEMDSYEIEPVRIETVSDTSHFYTLSLSPGWFSTDRLTIERMNDKPLLKKIDFHSDGTSADVAVNTVKTIAAIAGAATGINVGGATAVISDAKKLLNETILNNAAYAPCLGGVTIDSRLNRIQNFAINESSQAKSEWENIVDEQKNIEKIEERIKSQLNILAAEMDQKNIANIKGKIKIYDEQLLKSILKLNALKKVFLSSVNIVVTHNKIGPKTTETEIIRTFYADEILSSKQFLDCEGGETTCDGKNKLVYDDYLELHYGLTLDPAFDSGAVNNPYKVSSNKLWVDNGVYVRDSLPYRYTIYSIDNHGISTKMQSNIIQLFNKDVAPTAIDLSTAFFGDNKVLMQFTDKGTLFNAKVESASKAADLSTASEKVASGGLDSFKSSITKINLIKGEQYKIAQAKIGYQLALATKRNEILTQELTLEGTLASKEKALEKIKLDKDVEYLQSLKNKISLETDLSILEQANLSASNLDTVKNDKAMLQAQTETLKALQLLINELDKIRKSATGK